MPYHDEYSKELRNSCSSPHDLHLPMLTAPFGGSITQWCLQPSSFLAVVSSVVVAFFVAAGLIYEAISLGSSQVLYFVCRLQAPANVNFTANCQTPLFHSKKLTILYQTERIVMRTVVVRRENWHQSQIVTHYRLKPCRIPIGPLPMHPVRVRRSELFAQTFHVPASLSKVTVEFNLTHSVPLCRQIPRPFTPP